MRYPYLISSDQHCHAWSQFSTVGSDGVNSRLEIILDEMLRGYDMLATKKGNMAFLAGDLFHVRGRIEPSVFNPTVQMFREIDELETILTYAIPGNHDLEGKEATSLGNAMQSLDSLVNFHACTETQYVGDVVVIPWIQNLADLRKEIAKVVEESSRHPDQLDLIIHAPVNGVIKGIPDHGLEPEELAAYGFRRVFAGHFHDHKSYCDGKVYSIGATTHQTWGDVGTKAGFLLVYEDRVEHIASNAPQFIDLTPETMPDTLVEIEKIVSGNYVRLKLDGVTEKEIKDWRSDLEKCGAKGINLIATKKVTTGIRSGAASKSIHSLDASVQHYITNDLKPFLLEAVQKEAQEILNEARS